MSLDIRRQLYESLNELKIIDPLQLDNVYSESQKQNQPFGELLLRKDLISDENLGKVTADILQLPYIHLSTLTIPEDILESVPEVVAKKQRIIAFKKDRQGIHVAMSDPSNVQIAEFLKKKLGLPIIIYYATDNDIFDVFKFYSKNIAQTFDQIIKENITHLKTVQSGRVDPPIIKIVDTILQYAFQNKASDIHIEPKDVVSLVRFRIDGILHDIIEFPIILHNSIITRIKVMAELRTDEHQAAQDGRFQFKIEFLDNEVDVRVSLVPTTKGEKAVLRLLSERTRQYSLTELGFLENDYVKIMDAGKKPYGMILATGPTGCGKTTTMYAILKLLNKREVNIATIEDPVEYSLEGVNQIQVNPKTNLTFADGLSSILRQDPDVILVGEIRDVETSEIAVNSAMTGHLVLSTLHTNDAATSIPRLLDMKLEPYLLASTINVIIGQRLVRKIHLGCRTSKEVPIQALIPQLGKENVMKVFDQDLKQTIRVYYGKGCQICHHSGYEGRIGIFEVMLIDEKLRQAIIERKDSQALKELSIRQGMSPMIEDGILKVKQGLTTVEEIIRVMKE